MLAAVSSTTMYVMQQCGPTSFIVKEDSDGKQYHVTVGSLQQCTCQRQTQASAELCRHIVFVMVKVLKVHPENPLVWQLSLVGENHPLFCWCSVLVRQCCCNLCTRISGALILILTTGQIPLRWQWNERLKASTVLRMAHQHHHERGALVQTGNSMRSSAIEYQQPAAARGTAKGSIVTRKVMVLPAKQ